MARRTGTHRKPLFIVITTVAVWAVCETLIAIALPTRHPPVNSIDPRAFIEPHRAQIERLIHGQTEFVTFDPTLGWSHKPWGRGGIYRANGQGLRADRDYSPTPPPGVFRAETFGDSFMVGADVEVEKTWQALIEREDPSLEVMNFGVSGYGTDQAVLRYLTEGRAFAPDVVILSTITENALRCQTTFRPFYLPSTGLPMTKPRYRLEEGKLVLVPNPIQSLEGYQELLDHPETELPRIGRWDEFYHQYEPSTTPLIDNFPSVRAVRFWLQGWRRWWAGWSDRSRNVTDWYAPGGGRSPLLSKIFDRFHDQAVADGAVPVFLFFPIHFEYANGAVAGRMPYQMLVEFVHAKGYRSIDCADVFQPYLEDHPWSDLYAHGAKGGHYSPRAHQLIATAVKAELEKLRADRRRNSSAPPGRANDDGESGLR